VTVARVASALLAFSLLLGSCVSEAPAAVAPSWASITLEELRELAATEPLRALEAASFILGQDGREDSGAFVDELRGLARAAAASVASETASARLRGEPARALASWRSLRALAEDPRIAPLMEAAALGLASSTDAEGDLLAALAEKRHADGFSTAGLLIYLQALAPRDGGGREIPGGVAALRAWTERAFIAGNRSALRTLVAAHEARGIAVEAAWSGLLAAADPLGEALKGVVTIRVDRGMRMERGFGIPDRILGTGFYIDPAGYILTNYHVIESEVDPSYEGFSRLSIRPAHAPELRIPARVVGWDRLLDLALLKAETRPDYVFGLGPHPEFLPGDKVMAIGSPAGLENSITSGIVSAVGRRVLPVGEALQIDAALNPGNSGGPLLDGRGEVIGVVFAGMPQLQGLNFAIPVDWVLAALPALFEGGELKHPWLGLAVADLGASEGETRFETSWRHPSIPPGIAPGDRLISVDGRRFSSIAEIQAGLLARGAGELVVASVEREGRRRTELRLLRERAFAPLESAIKVDLKERLLPALFGMVVQPYGRVGLEGARYTVTRVFPGSIADDSGLSENDPFALRRFQVDLDERVILIQIDVKKRKSGFLESLLLLPAALDLVDLI
jgi:S1-C subfamily serine protease